jgi:hypothetical protein
VSLRRLRPPSSPVSPHGTATTTNSSQAEDHPPSRQGALQVRHDRAFASSNAFESSLPEPLPKRIKYALPNRARSAEK